MVIFELPTWSVADRLGRKKSYIIWLILDIIWVSFYLFSNTFLLFLVSAFLIWLWLSLQSGSIEALLSDNEKKSEKNFFAIWSGLFYFARFISMLISWILFIIHPFLPFVLYLCILLLKLISVLFIDEKVFEKSKEKTNFKQIKSTFREIKSNSDLLFFLGLLMFFVWAGNIFRITSQVILSDVWLNTSQIWYFYAVWALTSAISSYFVSKFKWNEIKFLLNMILSICVTIICFLTKNIIFILLGNLFMCVFFSYQMPLSLNYFWKKISSKNKATAFSIVSMWWTLGFVISSLYATFCLRYLNLEFYYISVLILVIIVFIFWKLYYSKSLQEKNLPI